jgi:hypothetical protein
VSTSRELAVYDPATPEKVTEPWLRRPDEGEEPWVKFQSYRDQPLPRQIDRVQGRTQTLREYARDFTWAVRVEAYDTMCEAHALKERLAAISTVAREAGAKDAVLLMRSYDLLNSEVEKLLRLSKDSSFEQTSVMKPGDLVKLAELVMKMKRLGAGEATENVAVAVGVKAFGESLSDEERIRLWELSQKAAG